MYGGVPGAVVFFPLDTPGTNTHMALDISPPSAEDASGGQRGLVSCLAVGSAPAAMAAELGCASLEILAVGTYAGDVGVYVTDPEWILGALESQRRAPPARAKYSAAYAVGGEGMCLCGWRVCEGNGIAQPHILFVATRQSNAILVYDTNYLYGMAHPFRFPRPPASDPALLARLPRLFRTPQRSTFDIDASGHDIVAGGPGNGDESTRRPLEVRTVSPRVSWDAHNDAVGSVAFHPASYALVLSACGARHWDTEPRCASPAHADTAACDAGAPHPDADALDAREEGGVCARAPHSLDARATITQWTA
ncbi:hypothetical protein MSPP1_002911 [Malassezia sp. CBS 17886]|nr:hypothetical protein MSPP1_002911 [Malassezia sp. CBS 17886]